IASAIANGLSAEQMSFALRAQPSYNEGIGAAIWDAMSGDVELRSGLEVGRGTQAGACGGWIGTGRRAVGTRLSDERMEQL
ncbi:MAG: hypothetical protein KHX84_26100, partial [Enterocloster asparagiformis]|nr:hypothetical protein [Enterocloster asparagiformis]